jgi:hypothetical protein
MSQKKDRIPSLKSLERECSNITLKGDKTVLLMTSPQPESTLASAILSRALIKSNRKFHITFVLPVQRIDTINEIRTKYNSFDVFIVGVDIGGSKRIKKGTSHPVLIGCQIESGEEEIPALGLSSTATSAAYVLAKSQMDIDMYNLQLAASGALIRDGMNNQKKGANKEIIELAQQERLIDARKGFKLFGVGMLPLDEALLHSTYPYLHTISGNQKTCDEILSAAEIPISKLRSPFSSLSSSEAQSLTSQLITRLDPMTVTQLLGTDYVLTRERETSPVRYVSGIEIMANTAWTRNELGMSMSVWLGDRGRALRVLIDSQMAHHKEVLSVVQRLLLGLRTESTPSATVVKTPGVKTETLPDVGRIALSNKLVDSDKPIVLDNDESITIAWMSSTLSLNGVLRGLSRKYITPSNTSPQSITLTGVSETKERGLNEFMFLYKEERRL